MAVSLNSVISFHPTANYKQINIIRSSLPKLDSITFLSREEKRSRFRLLATGGDIETVKGSDSNEGSSATDNRNVKQETSEAKPSSTEKRAPLTARERLRAARVLSRYTESKPSKSSKPQLGSKLLESLQESDKGKRRPGLPEAPTNMLDDSKRGMPKDGWTIEIPGGLDVFLIIVSFVVISSIMFATTYLVWKVGAIHFNE